VEPEFQYVMLEHPHMLNPDWKCRKKDIVAREYFRSCIESKGIDPDALLEYGSDEKRYVFPSGSFPDYSYKGTA
jgi:hypothetical protein